jgi:hypothetical protein
MEGFISNILLEINASTLVWLLYFFLSLMILVFIFILLFSFFKRRLDHKKKLWQENVSTIISQAIFMENNEEDTVEINPETRELLHHYTFRQYFINELIHAKKNLSGAPIANLIHFYEILDLDKDSRQKIDSKKWHIKAKGIQELAIMEQVKYVKQIFRLTNDPNELVRNEAQCALVHFYGFKGLRFLNVIIHPVSQWQQIQLLNYLHDSQNVDPGQLKKWLSSNNNWVVTIALRLAGFYNCQEVYREVIYCLQNVNTEVKMNALNYLKKINREDTSDEIIKCYASSERKVKLNILSVLQETGNERQVPFLMKQLHHIDDTIKLAAARALSRLHPLGAAFSQSHLFADEYPWDAIFSQINNERAA